MSKKNREVKPGAFWRTQPVLQSRDAPDKEPEGYGHALDPVKDPVKDVRQEPYALPPNFEWHTVDVNDPAEVAPSPSAACALFSCSSCSLNAIGVACCPFLPF